MAQRGANRRADLSETAVEVGAGCESGKMHRGTLFSAKKVSPAPSPKTPNVVASLPPATWACGTQRGEWRVHGLVPWLRLGTL